MGDSPVARVRGVGGPTGCAPDSTERPVTEEGAPFDFVRRHDAEDAGIRAPCRVVATKDDTESIDAGNSLDELAARVSRILRQHDVTNARAPADDKQAITGSQRGRHRLAAHLDHVEVSAHKQRSDDGEEEPGQATPPSVQEDRRVRKGGR